MRNLRRLRLHQLGASFSQQSISKSSWDYKTNSLIVATGPSESSPNIQLWRLQKSDSGYAEPKPIASWEVPSLNSSCDGIINLQYLSESGSCCVVLAGGDVIVVKEDPLPGEEQIEIVGTVDDGIAASRWSPDEQVLAAVTRSNSLILMSGDFDPTLDFKFTPQDLKASNHVSVGWGKAETQFKGKRAKALRDPTVPEHVDEGLLSRTDDQRVSISWRGDGEYLAVNSVDSTRRIIRVFSRDGVLNSVSEPVDFLQGSLSWRPAGNLIAGVKTHKDTAEVVFFERNGLRHGGFQLRLEKSHLDNIGLEWNADSTVLAVSYCDRVQLWTMGNYHYYLKQTIFNKSQDGPSQVNWNQENPLLLATHNDSLVQISDYAFVVARGSTAHPQSDFGSVGVIDGRTLKLTPLRYANMPPPMCLHELQLAHEAQDISINSSTGVVAVLTNEGVEVFWQNPHKKNAEIRVSMGPISLSDIEGDPLQIVVTNDRRFFLLVHGRDNIPRVYVSRITTEDTTDLGWEQCDTDRPVSRIFCDLTQDLLCAEALDGDIYGLASNLFQSLPRLPEYCPWVEVIQVGTKITVFGLSPKGQLYSGDSLLASNCTSFVATPAHLIFTTSNHLLKFIHLAQEKGFDVPQDEPEKDERCRTIERGAKLITVIPSAYSLVLQMPRGNLETIYPRALVLASIRQSINRKNYRSAFLSCRSQRVDMNIIYDHNPTQFIESVDTFIDQVGKVEYIDLFLSQLREEDVSQTMYKDTLGDVPQMQTTGSISKINTICNGFIAAFGNKSTRLQNLITAHVCKEPPDLEGGLRIISRLRGDGEDMAEKAAEHICFLADVHQLYDHALGIYDLDVALLIAQQSQMDPREYVPQLQHLQELPDLDRKFTINNNLKRHSLALAALYDIGDFEKLKDYTVKHELYSPAIELCRHQPAKLNGIMQLFASFLSSTNKFKEAAIAYEFLGDYASAMVAYRSANMWREALSCAGFRQLTGRDLTDMASDLADELEESKDYQGAARVCLDYLSDVGRSAGLLCKAYQFQEAIRLVVLHDKVGLLETVDTGLVECFNSTTELLADCKAQIGAQVPRLRELRVKKLQEPLAFYAGDASAGGDDIADDISLAPTDTSTAGGTLLTRYTGHTNGTLNTQTTRRTSKNRRREERKRARGKKGSVYEEEYLVNSFGRLVDRVNSVHEDVTQLIEGLMRRGKREQAKAIEQAMIGLVGLCSEVAGEVSEAGPGREQVNGAAFSEKKTGGMAVLADALESAQKPRQAPEVKAFERLSLLE